MNLELSTPALLFPAISLLILAHTNRFLALAKLIRELYGEYQNNPQEGLLAQIKRLKLRLSLIRWMQALGIVSLLICVVCIFLLLEGSGYAALIGFKSSLVLLVASLTISAIEIQISGNALNLLLSDLSFKSLKKQK